MTSTNEGVLMPENTDYRKAAADAGCGVME